MHGNTLIFTLFLVFSGAAVLSTLALLTRQSLLVAYMILGVVLGPYCLKWINDPTMVKHIGDIGIIFLLFLLGLHLPPQKLVSMIRRVTMTGFVSSVFFLGVGYTMGFFCGFTHIESIIIGAAMMFSSTIIGIKLLPTTVLHHQHTGELMISVLLLQDILAIVVLLLLHGASMGGAMLKDVLLIFLGLPGILLFAFLFERYVLLKLFNKFERIREYMFLVAIAWCLGMAQLAFSFGLSDEIGAFIAGVTLASSPISLYIAESLKPVRDFFLVMFFFSVGATFDLSYVNSIILPAIILACLIMVVKPAIYRWLLGRAGEKKQVGWEVGFRLGQASEFSLIIATVALDNSLISAPATYLIQATTMLTFVASSYYIVMKYPTPIATNEKLRRD